eukprot:TRINITY_DN4917_c0_g1_i7.p1 TRINITY_DN4917_c0_g1~~TRINITY_DN4917_c0_g1_i7.p1  ORF type:complete len:501 (+),score=147.13 TRINITY_DN4917_c0_g1_i7:71-1504(+)
MAELLLRAGALHRSDTQKGSSGLLLYVEYDGRKAAVDLDPDGTVADLQKAAAAVFGLSPEYALLTFRGQALGQPAAELADTGLSSESLLQVTLNDIVRYDPSSATNHVTVSDDGSTLSRSQVVTYGSVHALRPVPTDGCSRWGYRMVNVTDRTNVFVGVVPAPTGTDTAFTSGMAHLTDGALMLQSSGTWYPHGGKGCRPLTFSTGDTVAFELEQGMLRVWINGDSTEARMNPGQYYPAVELYSVDDGAVGAGSQLPRSESSASPSSRPPQPPVARETNPQSSAVGRAVPREGGSSAQCSRAARRCRRCAMLGLAAQRRSAGLTRQVLAAAGRGTLPGLLAVWAERELPLPASCIGAALHYSGRGGVPVPAAVVAFLATELRRCAPDPCLLSNALYGLLAVDEASARQLLAAVADVAKRCTASMAPPQVGEAARGLKDGAGSMRSAEARAALGSLAPLVVGVHCAAAADGGAGSAAA